MINDNDNTNELMSFENAEFGEVRTVEIDGDVWFVAADVCRVLEIKNSRDALKRLDDDDKGVVLTDTLGGQQEMTVVNESGLYSLVLGSRKKEAKAFKRWITKEVIPSIRRTGSYQAKPLTTAEMFRLQADYNLECDRKIAALAARQDETEAKVNAAAELLAAPSVRGDEWQEATNKTINEIVETYGFNHQKFRHDIYEKLEKRAGVDLTARQRNLRRRMKRNGATYADAQAMSKLHVIARDAKLRELFGCIVQQERARLVCAAGARLESRKEA